MDDEEHIGEDVLEREEIRGVYQSSGFPLDDSPLEEKRSFEKEEV